MDNYEMTERMRFNRELEVINKKPLLERKEARDKLTDELSTLEGARHFLTCCDFLLNGDYGAGAKFTWDSLTKRMNRRAWIFITVSQIEYGTSNEHAREVWGKLSATTQQLINNELDELIKLYEEEK